jgi:hypothetical protein
MLEYAAAGFYRETVVHDERGALRGHGRVPSVLRPGPPPRLRLRRDRRCLRRLRCSARHHRKHHYLWRLLCLCTISIGHANTDVVESRQPEASDPDQERGVHALLALLLPHLKRRRLVLLRPPHEGLLRRGTHSMRMASFNKLIMIFLTFNHPFLVCYYIAFLTFLSTRFQS